MLWVVGHAQSLSLVRRVSGLRGPERLAVLRRSASFIRPAVDRLNQKLRLGARPRVAAPRASVLNLGLDWLSGIRDGRSHLARACRGLRQLPVTRLSVDASVIALETWDV